MLLSRLRRSAPTAVIAPTRLHAAAGLIVKGLVEIRPEIRDENRIHQLLWMTQLLHIAGHGGPAFPNTAIATGAGPKVASLDRLIRTRDGLHEVLDPVHLAESDEKLEEVVRVVLKRHAHQTAEELRSLTQKIGGAWWNRYVERRLSDTEIPLREVVSDAAHVYGDCTLLDREGRKRGAEERKAAIAAVRARQNA